MGQHHCRHYSHTSGMSGKPQCAVGVDLSAPGAWNRCMPPPHDPLACFCPLDQPCHADVLLELANATPLSGKPEETR